MRDEVAALKLELLGLKAELQTLVHYLSTVRVQAGAPILGPDHWHQYEQDVENALINAIPRVGGSE